MQGVDLGPLVADPGATVRDHVLFAHATAHTSNIRATRWAIRGIFDGRHKYARYYGVGGGLPNDDFTGVPTPMLYGPDAAFEDQEHEWYDQQEDPDELVNLAMDNGRRTSCASRFATCSPSRRRSSSGPDGGGWWSVGGGRATGDAPATLARVTPERATLEAWEVLGLHHGVDQRGATSAGADVLRRRALVLSGARGEPTCLRLRSPGRLWLDAGLSFK